MLVHPSMIPVYNWYWYVTEYPEMTRMEREINLGLMGAQTLAYNWLTIAKTGMPPSFIRTFMNTLNYVFHTPGRPPLMTTIKPAVGTAAVFTATAVGWEALTTPGADYSRGPYGAVSIVPRLGW